MPDSREKPIFYFYFQSSWNKHTCQLMSVTRRRKVVEGDAIGDPVEVDGKDSGVTAPLNGETGSIFPSVLLIVIQMGVWAGAVASIATVASQWSRLRTNAPVPIHYGIHGPDWMIESRAALILYPMLAVTAVIGFYWSSHPGLHINLPFSPGNDTRTQQLRLARDLLRIMALEMSVGMAWLARKSALYARDSQSVESVSGGLDIGVLFFVAIVIWSVIVYIAAAYRLG